MSLRIQSVVLLAGALFAGVFTAAAAPVTYTKDIAPIFREKCEGCHHPNTGAPMSLQTYAEVRPWARSIKERVVRHSMPPWHIDTTVGVQHFANDMSLSQAQIDAIVAWVDSGAAQGDAKDLPVAKTFADDNGWFLEKYYGRPPDLVIKSEPYTVEAKGQDVWWKPLVDVPVDSERWVMAVEMRPGTLAGRRVTHHALAQLVQEEPKDPTDISGGPGLLMEWAIGKQFDMYRQDSGKLLLPGSKIRWDIHYHSVGEAIRDHVELAIYLYPNGERPKYRTRLNLLSAYPKNNDLDIPPNTITQTQAFHVLKAPARLENFQPHMHLRGKAMSMEAILPDGTTQMISHVDKFDFNWMTNYIFAEEDAPVLPKGTVLRITAWYDNTKNNKGNPDPNQWVGYGDRTVDEMGHAWVNITNLTDEDYAKWVEKHKPTRAVSASSQQ